MEKIRQRMEERKASKVTEIGCPDVKGKATSASGAASSSAKELCMSTDASKIEEKITGSWRRAKNGCSSHCVFCCGRRSTRGSDTVGGLGYGV